MLWIDVCPTCGKDVDKKSPVTRRYYGDTFYFDDEACAKVFDGTGSIVPIFNKLPH